MRPMQRRPRVLLLLSVGFRPGANAPIFVDHAATDRTVDPVVQALVLTDVVVGAAVAALLRRSAYTERPLIVSDAEFDSAVFLAIGFGIVRCDGSRLAIPGIMDAARNDALFR